MSCLFCGCLSNQGSKETCHEQACTAGTFSFVPKLVISLFAQYRSNRLLRMSSPISSEITSSPPPFLPPERCIAIPSVTIRWMLSSPVGGLALLGPAVRPRSAVLLPCAIPTFFRSANGKNTSSAPDGQRQRLGSAGLDRVEARLVACKERWRM